MSGSVISVNLAVPRANLGRRSGGPEQTGIDKRSVDYPVRAHSLGLDGDRVIDGKNHGGVDQAVYAYAAEDTAWWQAQLVDELSFVLGPGSLGENLTTAGIDVTSAVIGEHWRVGGVLLEVSRPRIPCATFAAFWGVDKLVKRFTAALRPGAYLRVLSEGQFAAGDEIVVLERPGHGLTIGEVFRALTGERSLAGKLLQAAQLPAPLRDEAERWIASAGVSS